MDLDNEFVRISLAEKIKNQIDSHCQEKFDDGHRKHLGASLIGRECSRYLWYVFRWAKHKVHSGRLYRLFQRGHREEAYIVEYLRAIGFEVREFDTESWDEKKQEHPQFRIEDCGGHFGGSLDGICKLPPEFGIDEWVLLEFKTINQNGHNKLTKSGMKKEKVEHFAQTCTYGKKKGYNYVVYISVCKNDDDLHIEVVPLDHSHGDDMIRKAADIINSQTPPQKCSQQPTYITCKFCDMKGVCHHDEPLDRNCRSCKNAEPMPGKVWECSINGVIPEEEIGKEQPCWISIQ